MAVGVSSRSSEADLRYRSVTTTAKNAWSAEFDATYADLGRLLTTNLECAEGCLGDQLSSLHQLRTELETQVPGGSRTSKCPNRPPKMH